MNFGKMGKLLNQCHFINRCRIFPEHRMAKLFVQCSKQNNRGFNPPGNFSKTKDMKNNLTEKQKEFLSRLPIGETVDVATSQYVQRTEIFRPVTHYTAQGVKALIDKGYLEGDVFWRGATVKRLKRHE